MEYPLKLFCGNANTQLATSISKYLNKELSQCKCSRFANGEIQVIINDNVRGSDVFIIQPTSANDTNGYGVNDAVMELLILTDAVKRGGANSITAVVPCFGYARLIQTRNVFYY